MRLKKSFPLVLGVSCSVVLAVAAGCGGSDDSTPNQGGSQADGGAGTDASVRTDGGTAPTVDAGLADAATTGDGAADAGADVDAAVPPPCTLGESCTAADKACVGLTANTGLTKFGLRMTELDLSAPTVLASGTLGATVANAVPLDLAACNQMGTGDFSWLLQFDTVAKTLKTGGSLPVAAPASGYSFVNTTTAVGQMQPATFTGVSPDATGAFAAATGQNAIIPVYLDSAGTESMLLPLHQIVVSGTLSSNDDCIGAYNASGLQPTNSCEPDTTATPHVPGFVDAAKVDAFIPLTDADTSIIFALDQSVCALLTGNIVTYGATNTSGVTVCKRDMSGAIVFKGDWCSTTNAAATATCYDAVKFSGTFAAGSITILN